MAASLIRHSMGSFPFSMRNANANRSRSCPTILSRVSGIEITPLISISKALRPIAPRAESFRRSRAIGQQASRAFGGSANNPSGRCRYATSHRARCRPAAFQSADDDRSGESVFVRHVWYRSALPPTVDTGRRGTRLLCSRLYECTSFCGRASVGFFWRNNCAHAKPSAVIMTALVSSVATLPTVWIPNP
jgi:hypothetical protein